MSESWEFPSLLRYDKEVLILDGDSLSTPVDLQGTHIVGVIVPATFSGTQLRVHAASSIAGTYREVRNTSNNPAVITCATNYHYAVVPFDLASVRYLKLQSNQSQIGETTIQLVTRPLS